MSLCDGTFLGEPLKSFLVSSYRRLILLKYSIADVSECTTDSGGCQNRCCNTVESYHCKCQAGQKLKEDGRGCEGSG